MSKVTAKSNKKRPEAVTKLGFARLTRPGITGPETVFVNPATVVLVETTPAQVTGVGAMQTPGGTIVHLMGQPLLPLIVSEPVHAVLEALHGASEG